MEPFPSLHPSQYAKPRPSETPEVHQLSSSAAPESYRAGAARRSVSLSQSVTPAPRTTNSPLFRSQSVNTDVVRDDEDGSRFREASLALVNRYGEEDEYDFDFDIEELERNLPRSA